MAEDDGLLMNLVSDNVLPQKKSKLRKGDRLQNKREERKANERLVQNLKAETFPVKGSPSSRQGEGSSPVKANKRSAFDETDRNKHQKRKREDGRDPGAEDEASSAAKKYKNTLFYNNPEIPRLNSAPVDTVSEQVFSGDMFSQLGIHPFMVSYLEKLGMTEVTAVQKQAIPQMLAGRDILVKSQTGSGKTLAYAVPVVQQLQEIRPKIDRADGLLALVIVPTRELALQTFDIFQKLVNPFTWVVPGCLMGGESRKKEKARLRKGLNIVISTPGRFVDHIKMSENLHLSRVGWLIIDEADRLLDMGFEKEVREIVNSLNEKSPKERRTALLSATLTTGVERLAGMSLQSPVKINLTSDEVRPSITSISQKPTSPVEGATVDIEGATIEAASKFATPENLKHHCVIVPSKLRLASLAAFLLWKCKMAAKKSKILVFMSTQEGVDFHHKIFQNVLFEGEEEEEEELLYRLHGDMAQKERTAVFKKFSQAETGVLLCTDVAARGLDLPQVKWIVQYTAPGGSTDYIHRVGRTARIGCRGNALLFLTPAEANYTKLLSDCNINLVEVQMNDILKTLLLEKHKLDYLWDDSSPPTTVQEAASLIQAKFTSFVQINQSARTMARKAYQSYIGAYSAYPSSVKHIFHVKGLHLGHVATSFALQEAPSKIGNIVGTQAKKHGDKKHREPQHKTRLSHQGALPSSMHRSNVSEFSSGMGKVDMAAKLTRKDRAKINSRRTQRQRNNIKFKTKQRGKVK